MMKKIILVLALSTAVVEHSFAFVMPPLLELARHRRSIAPKRLINQDQIQADDELQTQEPAKIPQATCELLMQFCADLADLETITTKDSTSFKKFLLVRKWLINNGALRDCQQKPELMTWLRNALAKEKDIPQTALANEMLRQLVKDVALLESRDNIKQDATKQVTK